MFKTILGAGLSALVLFAQMVPVAAQTDFTNSYEIAQAEMGWAEVQAKLNALGYNAGPVDGIAGRGTRNALAAFQRDRGVVASGDLNQTTLTLLAQLPDPAPRQEPRISPGFDCAKAGNAAERGICSSNDLARLDLAINAAYGAARAGMTQSQRSALLDQQRGWVSNRNACGGDVSCLQRAMATRLQQLAPGQYVALIDATSGAGNPPLAEPVLAQTGPVPTPDGRKTVRIIADTISSTELLELAFQNDPSLLNAPQVRRNLLNGEAGRFLRDDEVRAADLDRIAADWAARQTTLPMKMMLSYESAIFRDNPQSRYNPDTQSWSVFYGMDGPPQQFSILPLSGLENGEKVSLDLTELPQVFDIPMDQAAADAFATQVLRNKKLISTRTNIYFTLNDFTFDRSRNQFVTDLTYEGADIRAGNRIIATAFPQGAADTEGGAGDYLALEALFPQEGKVRDGYLLSSKYRTRAGTTLDRVLLSALIAKAPQLMDVERFAIEMAPRLLTANERPIFERGIDRLDYDALNQFDRRDLFLRMRDEFGDVIASRSIDAPLPVAVILPGQIREYVFEASAFSLEFDLSRTVSMVRSGPPGIPELDVVFGRIDLPDAIPMDQDDARALAARLNLGPSGLNVFVVVYARTDRFDGDVDVASYQNQLGNRGRVEKLKFTASANIERIEVFADQQLTDMLYAQDFNPPVVDPDDLLTQLTQAPLTSLDDVLALATTLPGGANVPRSWFTRERPELIGDPAQMAVVVDDLLAQSKARLGDDGLVELAGTVSMGAYEGGQWAVNEVGLFNLPGQAVASNRVSFTPQLTSFPNSLAISAEVFARTTSGLNALELQRLQFAMRMRARPVTASTPSDWQIGVGLEPVSFSLLAGDPSSFTPMQIVTTWTASETSTAGPNLATTAGFDPDLTHRPLTVGLLPAMAVAQDADGAALGDNVLDPMLLAQIGQEHARISGAGYQLTDITAPIPGEVLLPVLQREYRNAVTQHDYSQLQSLHIEAYVDMWQVMFRLTSNNAAKIDACGALKPAEMTTSDRDAGLLAALGVPSPQDVLNAAEQARSLGTYDDPALAPYVVFEPLYPSALSCVGSGADLSPLNTLSRALTGESMARLDGRITDQSPRIFVVAQDFPVSRMTPGGAYNAAQFDARIVKVAALPRAGFVDDFAVLVAPGPVTFNKNEVQDGTGLIRTKVFDFDPDVARAKADASADVSWDILGLTTDMTVAEADQMLRDRFEAPIVMTSAERGGASGQAFRGATIYLANDLSERITLYTEPSTGPDTILAIERVINSPNFAIPMAGVRTAAEGKYGDAEYAVMTGDVLQLEWGDAIMVADNTGNKTRSMCGLSYTNTTRIEEMTDADGNPAQWWTTFDWPSIRNGFLPYVPSLYHYRAGEEAYGLCGNYLAVMQNGAGIVTIMLDLPAYEAALNQSFSGDAQTGPAADGEAAPAIEF